MSHFISNRLSPFNWVKKNLFSNLFNTILTLISLLLIFWISSALISWSFFQAQWGVIGANLRLFFVGQYPVTLLWRAWISLTIIISLLGFSWGVLYYQKKLLNRINLSILALIAVILALLGIPISVLSSIKLLGILILFVIAALM
ncbi:MAG: amino acid ABC transporter permease, partial [Crocosphaera sp.]